MVVINTSLQPYLVIEDNHITLTKEERKMAVVKGYFILRLIAVATINVRSE